MKDNRKYTLKEGVVLRPYGVNSLIDNNNLTDQIAVFLIETGKAEKENFNINKKEK